MTPDPFFDRDLSRRAFLGGGLAVAGGLITAASLGSAAFAASANKLAPLVLSSDLYVSDQPQRLVVALARGGKSGIKFVSGPAAQFRFQPPKTPGGPTPTATAWVKAPLDRAGLPKGRGVYVTAPVLDTAGVWDVEVKAQGERVPFKIQVNAAAVAPVVGQAAPRAPVTDRDRHPRREPDLHPAADVPAAHGVAGIGDRRGQARRRALRHSCTLPVAVLRAGARRDARDHGPVPGPHHVRAHRDLPGASPAPRSCRRSRRGISRASRGSSRVDGAGVIQSRLDGAFGGDEMKVLLDELAG